MFRQHAPRTCWLSADDALACLHVRNKKKVPFGDRNADWTAQLPSILGGPTIQNGDHKSVERYRYGPCKCQGMTEVASSESTSHDVCMSVT